VPRRNGIRSAVLALVLIAALPALAQAETVTVTTVADGNDGECADDCTLREALATSSDEATIVVPAGTYVAESASFSLTGSRTIQGAGAGATRISGPGRRVLMVATGAPTVTGVRISDGNAPGAGGGIHVASGADLTLRDSLVDHNTAVLGGGIYSEGTLTVERSLIQANDAEESAAPHGGGVTVNGGAATLTNTTISGNGADGSGGGLHVTGGGAVALQNVTLAENAAGAATPGHAIYQQSGIVTATNTLIALTEAGACRLTATIVWTAGMVQGADTSCGAADGNLAVGVDPLVSFLDDNGGPTATYALQAGSPAIDTGAGECPATDQRGYTRPAGSDCDIGAYEYDSVPAAEPVLLDGSPLDIWVDGAGRFQFRLDGQPDGVFYPPEANAANAGLEIATAGGHYGLGIGRIPVERPMVEVDGDEQSVTSTYRVGPDLLVVEQLEYDAGDQSVDVGYAITNTSQQSVDLRAGELADLYVGGSDQGHGVLAEATEFRFVGGRSEAGAISGMVERTGWDSFQEGFYADVFDAFAADAFDDTVVDDLVDNGVGVEWEISLPPGEEQMIAVQWRVGVQSVVNTTDDHDDGACLPAETGDCTLREALAHGLPGEEVLVPAGDYPLTRALEVNHSVTLVGDGAGVTSIVGSGDDRVLSIFSGDVAVSGVLLTGGDVTADGGLGGGVYVAPSAGLELAESTIGGNAAGVGGGIFSDGFLSVERTTIAGNDATGDGGGIHASGGARIQASTISDNGALGQGGGIYNEGDSLRLRNVTLAENQGSDGTALYHAPSSSEHVLELRNALIAASDGDGAACATLLGTIEATATIDEDGSCPGAETVDDVLVGELGDHGGPTPDHRLLADSPAIDAGEPEYCTELDQRGAVRRGACDVGAVEELATLSVRMNIRNDSGGAATASDLPVRVLRGDDDVAGSPAISNSDNGVPFHVGPGAYTVAAGTVTGYTSEISGACAPDGAIVLEHGDERECLVTFDDVGSPSAPQGGGGGDASPPPPPPPGGDEQELPPPVAGEEVNAEVARGTVKVRLPGSSRFVDLGDALQLPVGTIVDALKGRVTLVAAGGQEATFYAGIFKIGQGRGARPLTTLTLVEKLSCPRGRGASTAAKRKKKRRLWGNGSGKFRTRGKHSAATVVGTKWLVEDRCTSTLTRVTRGRVKVRDFVKKRTVTVRAGKKYVAKARKR
jgi:CSLREA domain-containing protein